MVKRFLFLLLFISGCCSCPYVGMNYSEETVLDSNLSAGTYINNCTYVEYNSTTGYYVKNCTWEPQ